MYVLTQMFSCFVFQKAEAENEMRKKQKVRRHYCFYILKKKRSSHKQLVPKCL